MERNGNSVYMEKKLKCRKCGSKDKVKAGKVRKKQRYECKQCGSRFIGKLLKKYDNKTKVKNIVKLYLEGMSIRGIGRYIEVSHSYVIKRIQQQAEKLKPMIPLKAKAIEIDELYFYIKSKKRKRWLWTAFCRESGRIINWQIGGRDESTLKKLYYKISPVETEEYFTDKYAPYRKVLPIQKHRSERGCTNRIEGFHSALRHYAARFRRRSKCYSKSEVMVEATMSLMMYKCQNDYENRAEQLKIAA